MFYDKDTVTDQPERQIVAELIREKALRLLDQETISLDFYYGTDSFFHEFDAGMYQWYDDRFIVHGCQVIENPRLRNTQRVVFYVQKIQYE